MNLDGVRRILLCLRYGIGDVVMETPVLTVLRRQAPDAHLTVLGARPAMSLLEGDPRADEVVGIDRWGLTHRWDRGDAGVREAIAEWFRSRRFDLMLDVHHAAEAVAATVWSLGITTVESDDAREDAAVRSGADGVAAIKAAVREGWGMEVPADLGPALRLRPGDRDLARAFLAAAAVLGRPVGLSPVASLPMKRWPAARFAAVADWVVERGCTPLLFTGPQEDEGEAILSAMRRPDRVVAIGPMHLLRIAALMQRCALFVCNDTGLMHIAAAVGTPVVALFGPTSPAIYLPPAPRAVGLVGCEIHCPYRNTASLHPPGCWTSDHCLIAPRSCIEQVPVADVLEAAAAMLGSGEMPSRPGVASG